VTLTQEELQETLNVWCSVLKDGAWFGAKHRSQKSWLFQECLRSYTELSLDDATNQFSFADTVITDDQHFVLGRP